MFDVERTHIVCTQVEWYLVDTVREKGGSIFEHPVLRLANLLEVSNEPKD